MVRTAAVEVRERRATAERRTEAVAGERSMATRAGKNFEERVKKKSKGERQPERVKEGAKGDVGRLFDISAPSKGQHRGRAPDRELELAVLEPSQYS